MADSPEALFESWRTCEHCGGTGEGQPAAGAPTAAPIACPWCKDGRYPVFSPDSTTLTPEQLAEVLRPLRKKP
jgi:hypothetical protein